MTENYQAGRRQRGLQLCRQCVLRGFNFHVAPAAACTHRLQQNLKLCFPAATKKATSLTAAACCNQRRPRLFLTYPGEEDSALSCISEIVEAQLKRLG